LVRGYSERGARTFGLVDFKSIPQQFSGFAAAQDKAPRCVYYHVCGTFFLSRPAHYCQ
jgi:hypothetical protein